MLKAPSYLANFDSATAMLRALGRYLHGKDFPGLGIYPSAMEPVARLINHLPRRTRETLYAWGGWGEAIPVRRLRRVRAELLSKWVVSHYPRYHFPAVAIGSSSGALVHLCAALGIPWLPQTFLIPVARSGIHPDEPRMALEWGKDPGRQLLAANPELQLHHMHDPNQDRLMIRRMTYFRVKRLRLVLADTLPPGGTILLSECTLKWPTVRVDDRHIFQFGALGGATPEEYHAGGPRVADYLQRYGSHRQVWNPPLPDGERPEAEWGFEEALCQDVERIARRRGYRVERLIFENPEHLSPLAADLYRWWYRQRGLPANRLLAESFIVFEPFWALRTGSVPFWMTFNKEPSARLLEEYLNRSEPFDEIYLMLFSHGVDSIGLVPIPERRRLLGHARRRGDFIGVDERTFPRDFAVFVRYHLDLKRTVSARHAIPGPLPLEQFSAFMAQRDMAPSVSLAE